jgi:hypothetical protein
LQYWEFHLPCLGCFWGIWDDGTWKSYHRVEITRFSAYSVFPVTSRLENRSKSSWGGRRKGAGRKPRIPRGDDYEERLAVYDAFGAFMDRLKERLEASDRKSERKSVIGWIAGLQCAIADADGYRSEVNLKAERVPTTRLKFQA